MSDTSTPRRARKRPERKLSGPKNLYRKKVRKPISIVLTKDTHVVLKRYVRESRMSRSDYFETLVIEHGDKVKARPTEVHGRDAPAESE